MVHLKAKCKYLAGSVLALLVLMFSPADQGKADDLPLLLVFGDSLVAGYGLPKGESFVDELDRQLNAGQPSVRLINGGVSGDTSAGGVSRIGWALGDDPDAVLVVLGGNDALRGLPTDALEANLDQIVSTVQAQGLPVLIAGMKSPRNMGESYGRDFDQAFANVLDRAEDRGGEVFFYPFFLDGVALVPELNQDDGIHPNPAGVAEIVRRIKPDVETLLEATQRH